MTSLDPKIIMREKGIETAKPIHPASRFRYTRLQIYSRRHVLERMKFRFVDHPRVISAVTQRLTLQAQHCGGCHFGSPKVLIAIKALPVLYSSGLDQRPL
jgi:hypothetical protein